MRSMRTLPCRRRGGSSVAPTRMPGPRDAGRARCTQAAALPAFGLDGSLFHHACRLQRRISARAAGPSGVPLHAVRVRLRSAHHAADARTIVRGAAAAAAARRRTAAVGAGRGTRTARAHGNMSCRMIWSRSGVRWGLGRPRIWNSIGRTGVAD